MAMDVIQVEKIISMGEQATGICKRTAMWMAVISSVEEIGSAVTTVQMIKRKQSHRSNFDRANGLA
ncbi:MAG: hypothetical protein ACLT1J_14020 [Mediterraneibacter gnavus]